MGLLAKWRERRSLRRGERADAGYLLPDDGAEGASPSTTRAADHAAGVFADRFPGHAAAFAGDRRALGKWLDATPRDDWARHDPQGMTVAHLAVLRGHLPCLELLLSRGFPIDAEDARGWVVLEDAIAKRDRAATRAIMERKVNDALAKFDRLQRELVQRVREMPDFTLQLDWRLTSPVFGLLLKKLAPSDTYTIYKRGARLRIDGSLRGAESSGGLIPRWVHGAFSLLVIGDEAVPRVVIVDHVRRAVFPLMSKVSRREVDVAGQVDEAMEAGAAQMRFEVRDKRLTPVGNWLGGTRQEVVNGYNAGVYDMSGHCYTRFKQKAEYRALASGRAARMTYEDFCRLDLPPDQEEEMPVSSLFSMGDVDPRKLKKAAAEAAAQQGAAAEEDVARLREEVAREQSAAGRAARRSRPLKARCWMTSVFPLKPTHLRPILDILSVASNPALRRAADLVEAFGGRQFPVKAQVPLALSVSLELSFGAFAFLNARGAGLPDMGRPAGYREATMDEARALALERQKRREDLLAGRGAPRAPSDYGSVSSADSDG